MIYKIITRSDIFRFENVTEISVADGFINVCDEKGTLLFVPTSDVLTILRLEEEQTIDLLIATVDDEYLKKKGWVHTVPNTYSHPAYPLAKVTMRNNLCNIEIPGKTIQIFDLLVEDFEKIVILNGKAVV